jgi:alpha/beta hydrolase family protein
MTAIPNIVLVHGAWATAQVGAPSSSTYKRVMFAVQQPLHWSAVEEVMGVPAWKALPSWFLIADGDQAIPPDAQRQFAARMGATTEEVSTNHVAMVSHPKGCAAAHQDRRQCTVGRNLSVRRCEYAHR